MKRGHGSKFSAKWEAAIAALLTGVSLADAADTVGVSERTLKNWLTDPDFKAALQAARTNMLERTINRLLTASGKALFTLVKNLDDGKGAVRNTAALGILDRAARGIEMLDLAARVEEIEQRLNDQEADRK